MTEADFYAEMPKLAAALDAVSSLRLPEMLEWLRNVEATMPMEDPRAYLEARPGLEHQRRLIEAALVLWHAMRRTGEPGPFED